MRKTLSTLACVLMLAACQTTGMQETEASAAQPRADVNAEKVAENPSMTIFVFKAPGANGHAGKPNGYRFSFKLYDQP